jgi:hypothetical protein
VWCSDDLHRLNGNGGAQGLGAWQVDYANSTLLLSAPQASCAMNERLYGYCNDGMMEIDSAGNVRNLTDGVIGNLLPGPRYREVPGIIVERNETDGEVLLTVGEREDGRSDRVYVYHVRQRGWTELSGDYEWLQNISALAMFRLPPGSLEAHVLFAANGGYYSWNRLNYIRGAVQYQPLYGDDPLELKRWMWADYLFDANSEGTIRPLWNTISFVDMISMQKLDAGNYARAGCPREVGLSHSISPGFEWEGTSSQRRFEGISLAIKQRTNQSKLR